MSNYSIKPKAWDDSTIQLPPFYEEDICMARSMEGIEKMGGNPCINHRQADQLLCEILLSIGFKKTVEEFRKMEKWYA